MDTGQKLLLQYIADYFRKLGSTHDPLDTYSAAQYEMRKWGKLRFSNSVCNQRGLCFHIDSTLYSILHHSNAVVSSCNCLIEYNGATKFGVEQWIVVTREFINGSIRVFSAIDLLGHLLWLVNDWDNVSGISNKSNAKSKFLSSSWDFNTYQKSQYITDYCKQSSSTIGNQVISNEIDFIYTKIPLDVALEYLRHGPVHGSYNYIIARKSEYTNRFQWILVDPRYSIRETIRQRQESRRKPHNWNSIKSDIYFPNEVMEYLTFDEILWCCLTYTWNTLKAITALY